MLLQFNFKNFKSFRDDTTLDLTATKITEYGHHIVTVGSEKVLPVAAIYGANASGKSNVYEAFEYMSFYVYRSFGYGGSDAKDRREDMHFQPTPFLLDTESSNSESSFEVYFITSEEEGAITYNYGFTVDAKGVNEEWLNSKAKSARRFRRIFYRNGDEIDLVGIDRRSRENIEIALEREALIVSLGAKLKIEKLQAVRNWFLRNEFADFGHPEESYFLSKLLPDRFDEDRSVQQKVLNYLAEFDTSIVDFNVEVIEKETEDDSIRLKIDAIHKMSDSDQTIAIPLRLESAGTLKMFALYPLIQNVLEEGSVLFVDELNARLHPLLMRLLIIKFVDPDTNPKHAQLLFTTHDAWLLSGNILRRDEVWFTEKDASGVSTLYSLADFVDEDGLKIRKDENYEKNYLLGKYGAIPTLKHVDVFGEVRHD